MSYLLQNKIPSYSKWSFMSEVWPSRKITFPFLPSFLPACLPAASPIAVWQIYCQNVFGGRRKLCFSSPSLRLLRCYFGPQLTKVLPAPSVLLGLCTTSVTLGRWRPIKGGKLQQQQHSSKQRRKCPIFYTAAPSLYLTSFARSTESSKFG